MSTLNAWADIHGKTIGAATVFPACHLHEAFATVKLPDARVNTTILGDNEAKSRMEVVGDATLFLSIPAARELAHALLELTGPAEAPAPTEVAA